MGNCQNNHNNPSSAQSEKLADGYTFLNSKSAEMKQSSSETPRKEISVVTGNDISPQALEHEQQLISEPPCAKQAEEAVGTEVSIFSPPPPPIIGVNISHVIKRRKGGYSHINLWKDDKYLVAFSRKSMLDPWTEKSLTLAIVDEKL
jgi:hypothetical protein